MLTALIPARSGSKRVPGKNFRELGGKALIDWTLEFALRSSLINKVIVSLDEICPIFRSSFLFHFEDTFGKMKYNSLTNISENLWVHKRTPESSRDNSRTIEVVREIYEKDEDLVDDLVLLQPTSPFRMIDEFAQMYKLFKDAKTISCVSVARTSSPHPLKSFQINEFGEIANRNLDLNFLATPEQNLEQFFHVDGAYYLIRLRNLIESGLFVNANTKFFKREGLHTLNIDNEFDMELAEYLVENNKIVIN